MAGALSSSTRVNRADTPRPECSGASCGALHSRLARPSSRCITTNRRRRSCARMIVFGTDKLSTGIKRLTKIFQATDENGLRLDARFSVEEADVILHSRGGAKGQHGQLNADYTRAMLLLIGRLAQATIPISGAWVDSKTVQSLPLNARSILDQTEGNLPPEQICSLLATRMKQIRSDPNSTAKGGNSTKRIRIATRFGGSSDELAAQLGGIAAAAVSLLEHPDLGDDLEAEGVALLGHLTSRGYNGERLAACSRTRRLLAALAREGFKIRSSGRGLSENGKTIVVEWEEGPGKRHYVGYEPNDMQRMDLLLGIPFLIPEGGSRNRKTIGFDLAALAQATGVPVAHLHLTPEKPKGQRQDGVEEQYLRVSEHDSAMVLVRAITAALCPSFQASEIDSKEALEERALAELRKRRPILSAAMYERVSKARRGQGRYRDDLMRLFGGRCAVSGLGISAALRASHSLAWGRCETDEQRIDENNGLLLSANLDALYDKYLISYSPSGAALVSESLSAEDLHKLGFIGGLRVTPSAAQAEYLEMHQREFVRMEKLRKQKTACVKAVFDVDNPVKKDLALKAEIGDLCS